MSCTAFKISTVIVVQNAVMNGYVVQNKWTDLQYWNDINIITTLLRILVFGSDDFSGTVRVYVANLTHTVHVILHRKYTGLLYPSQGNATCLKRRLCILIGSAPDGIYYRYSISLCS